VGSRSTSLLVVVVILIVGAIFYLDSKSPKTPNTSAVSVTPVLPELPKDSVADVPRTISREGKAKQYPLAKEIVNPSGFINTGLNPDGSAKSVTIQSLIGKKVVLLDIWTYSCINCQRTLPYLKDWYEKYKDQGLEIIGLHAPEFEFEKDYANVSAAVEKLGVTWPVVLDNDFGTARSYGMRYWPEEYLIDIDGYIVHKSVGEGGYDETEAKIQELLNERMKVLGLSAQVKASISKIDAPAPQSGSPETYFGSARNEYLGNGISGRSGEQTFTLPSAFQANALYLGGLWNIQNEYAENKSDGASIVFKYKAKEVYFVASSKSGARVKIYSDGKPVGDTKGDDVAADGTVFIKEDRLYKIIKNSDVSEHTIKIEIESAGLKAYTFTFG